MDISTKFDFVIWTLVGVSLLVEVIILLIPFLRRNSKAKIFFVFLFVCQLLVLYGSFMEPRMITVAHYTTELTDVGRLVPQKENRFFIPRRTPEQPADVLRVALLADLHVGPYKQSDYVERIADQLIALEPDAIVMPGDFVYYSPDDLVFLEPLSRVTKTIPMYASLGNHDYNWREQHRTQEMDTITEEFRYSQKTVAIMESYGITMLQDDADTLEINGQTLHIIGQHDWWATERMAATDITNVDANDQDLSILIQHNPDGGFFQDLPESIDLMVSGHTHGGQVRLPFIGSLHPLPTEMGNSVDQGWFHLPNPEQLLYVTHGIGEMGPRARLFAWPEIVVFDISESK